MFRRSSLLSFLPVVLQRFILVECELGQSSFQRVRTLSRSRTKPEWTKRRKQGFDKTEYREKMLERARLRRASVSAEDVIEKGSMEEATVQATETDPRTEEEAESESLTEEEGSEEDEAEIVNESTLFAKLLQYTEPERSPLSERYVPYEVSEDDDEYRPAKEEDFTEEWFRDMEEDARLAKEDEVALYPEEEVTVKLLDFESDEEKEQAPVILKMVSEGVEPTQETKLYLRKPRLICSTKTKLFDRRENQHWIILDSAKLESSVLAEYHKEITEIQSFLDWSIISQARIGHYCFQQFKSHPVLAIQHVGRLIKMLPSHMSLNKVAQSTPEAILLKHSKQLNVGMKCIGSLYPALTDFKERFKLGIFEPALLRLVIRMGTILKSVQECLPAHFKTSLNALNNLIEKAVSTIPEFVKLMESSLAETSPETIAQVLLQPSLTLGRLESCKSNIHNWSDFNFYLYPDFTLSKDEVEFKHFCEMYNMTRKLQIDFSEAPTNSSTTPLFSGIHNIPSERITPNGILPHQFTSIYEVFLILEQEGMSWATFLQGLAILSEQREVGVYAELHFYEKLRKSRTRSIPSVVLRNGLVSVMRMMCANRQLQIEREPTISRTPIFEVTPIIYESDVLTQSHENV